MESQVDFQVFARVVEDSLTQHVCDLELPELKKLDWFTWDTDFFLANELDQAA